MWPDGLNTEIQKYNLTKAEHMQTIFESVNVVQHIRKIYTMYGNLNGQLNYLG